MTANAYILSFVFLAGVAAGALLMFYILTREDRSEDYYDE